MRTFNEKEKRFIGTTVLIVFCFIFFAFFEQTSELSSIVQGFIIATIFFFCLPLLYCKFILDEPLAHMGIQTKEAKHVPSFLWSLFLAFGGFVIVWLLQRYFPALGAGVVFPVLVETHFLWFVLYALIVIPITFVVYEIFFRGMIQMLWLGNTWLAVIIQACLFVILVWLSEGITLSDTPLLMTALLSGIALKQTKSLWYAFFTTVLFIFLTDVLFLSLR